MNLRQGKMNRAAFVAAPVSILVSFCMKQQAYQIISTLTNSTKTNARVARRGARGRAEPMSSPVSWARYYPKTSRRVLLSDTCHRWRVSYDWYAGTEIANVCCFEQYDCAFCRTIWEFDKHVESRILDHLIIYTWLQAPTKLQSENPKKELSFCRTEEHGSVDKIGEEHGSESKHM